MSIHIIIKQAQKKWISTLAMLLLPLPFCISSSLEIQEQSNPLAAAVGYAAIFAASLTYVFQILYVAQCIDEGLDRPLWKSFIRHLPGNILIIIIMEMLSFIPMFIEGIIKNNFEGSRNILIPSKFFVGIFIGIMFIEVWFRYFRRFQPQILRRDLINNQTWILLFNIFGCALATTLPNQGIPLAFSSVLFTVCSISLWETLASEIHKQL